MSKQAIPAEILKKLRAVTSKRPKTVIEHIIEHGYITTEELKKQYGYNHPPRAARDVREHGISLVTFKVQDPSGRSIAAYRFGKGEVAEYDQIKHMADDKTLPDFVKKLLRDNLKRP